MKNPDLTKIQSAANPSGVTVVLRHCVTAFGKD
jgi:hypothetical protein